MKKAAIILAVISVVVFLVAWGIIGLQLLDGDYEITAGAYTALAALIAFMVCAIYIKSTLRCPHCGSRLLTRSNYCPHCGKDLR